MLLKDTTNFKEMRLLNREDGRDVLVFFALVFVKSRQWRNCLKNTLLEIYLDLLSSHD